MNEVGVWNLLNQANQAAQSNRAYKNQNDDT